jgi:hypothetical protein
MGVESLGQFTLVDNHNRRSFVPSKNHKTGIRNREGFPRLPVRNAVGLPGEGSGNEEVITPRCLSRYPYLGLVVGVALMMMMVTGSLIGG